MTIVQAKKVQAEFEKKYLFKKPWSEYVNGVGLGHNDRKELCIQVYLRKQPPANLVLPKTYKGLAVVYLDIGDIRAF